MLHNYKSKTAITKLQEIFSTDTTTSEIEEDLTQVENKYIKTA